MMLGMFLVYLLLAEEEELFQRKKIFSLAE